MLQRPDLKLLVKKKKKTLSEPCIKLEGDSGIKNSEL